MSQRSRAYPWWGRRETPTTTRPLQPRMAQPTRAELLAAIDGIQRRSADPKFVYAHAMLPDEWEYFFDMRIPLGAPLVRQEHTSMEPPEPPQDAPESGA